MRTSIIVVLLACFVAFASAIHGFQLYELDLLGCAPGGCEKLAGHQSIYSKNISLVTDLSNTSIGTSIGSCTTVLPMGPSTRTTYLQYCTQQYDFFDSGVNGKVGLGGLTGSLTFGGPYHAAPVVVVSDEWQLLGASGDFTNMVDGRIKFSTNNVEPFYQFELQLAPTHPFQ